MTIYLPTKPSCFYVVLLGIIALFCYIKSLANIMWDLSYNYISQSLHKNAASIIFVKTILVMQNLTMCLLRRACDNRHMPYLAVKISWHCFGYLVVSCISAVSVSVKICCPFSYSSDSFRGPPEMRKYRG